MIWKTRKNHNHGTMVGLALDVRPMSFGWRGLGRLQTLSRRGVPGIVRCQRNIVIPAGLRQKFQESRLMIIQNHVLQKRL